MSYLDIVATLILLLLAGNVFYLFSRDEQSFIRSQYEDETALQKRSIVKVKSMNAAQKCSVCHDNWFDFMCNCGATYHVECWNSLNKCATLGCFLNKRMFQRLIKSCAYNLWVNDKSQPSDINWLAAEKAILEHAREYYPILSLQDRNA